MTSRQSSSRCYTMTSIQQPSVANQTAACIAVIENANALPCAAPAKVQNPSSLAHRKRTPCTPTIRCGVPSTTSPASHPESPTHVTGQAALQRERPRNQGTRTASPAGVQSWSKRLKTGPPASPFIKWPPSCLVAQTFSFSSRVCCAEVPRVAWRHRRRCRRLFSNRLVHCHCSWDRESQRDATRRNATQGQHYPSKRTQHILNSSISNFPPLRAQP